MAEKLYAETLALAERTGDRRALSGAHRSYAFYLGISGQTGAAQLAEDAVREADESGDLRTRIAARYGSVWVHAFCSVDPALGLRRAEEGIELVGDDLELGSEVVGMSPRLMFEMMRSETLGQLGRLSESKAGLDWVSAHDPEAYRVPVASARTYSVCLAERMGDASTVLAVAERLALDLGRQPDMLSTLKTAAAHFLGVAQAMNERWDEALATFDDALDERQAAVRLFGPLTLAWKARVLMHSGAPDEARTVVDEAIDRARHVEQPFVMAEALLVRARLQIEFESSADRAESDIAEAAEIVTRLGFRATEPTLHEARAALARLRDDEAGWRRELEQARDVARAMGAGPRAERIAALLPDSDALAPPASAAD